MSIKTDYTREELIEICEKSFVPQKKWLDRDSAEAQKQLGHCYAWLKAGCDFKILTQGDLKSDSETIWVEIFAKGFARFDWGGELDRETFYLPTKKRLDSRKNGADWY